MKARKNRSGTIRQLELKAKHKLTDQMFQDMLEMLAGLTAAERETLKDADFITEDEADLIVSDRSMDVPGESTSADEIFAEYGYVPRSRRNA
jgi:hypothetical protein